MLVLNVHHKTALCRLHEVGIYPRHDRSEEETPLSECEAEVFCCAIPIPIPLRDPGWVVSLGSTHPRRPAGTFAV